MITAKCNKCGGSASAETYDEARKLINHAVGLSRGVKCGDNYNMVCQVEDSTPKKPTVTKPQESTEKPKESPPTEQKETTEKPKTEKSKKSKFRLK